MAARVPLPPPRNLKELNEQIETLENRIRFNNVFTGIMLLTFFIVLIPVTIYIILK